MEVRPTGNGGRAAKKLIAQDGEAQLLSYYIERGWDAEMFLSLDLESRLYYTASMQFAEEKRDRFFSMLMGGNG